MDTHDNLYDKLSAEFDTFIEDLKSKPPDEIISRAYEKVFKEDILMTFEEGEFSSQEIANLMALESPLDFLYSEWLDTDASYIDMLRDCIDDSTKRLIKEEPAIIDTRAINGKIACFDLVISTADSDYPFLVGEVNAVEKLGSEEHDSGNSTDDVFVDFRSEDYSEQRIKEIEEHFSKLYGEPKKFEDLSLDNVTMAPNMLIRISESDLESLLESRHTAEIYCNAILEDYAEKEIPIAESFPTQENQSSEKSDGLRAELMERIENNYTSYKKDLMKFGKGEIIDMADKIKAMDDAHRYMTTQYHFDGNELEFYLKLQNPLEVIADYWVERNYDISDIDSVIYDICDKEDALTLYPLAADISAKMPEKPFADRKPSIEERLKAGKEKSDEYRSKNPVHPINNEKEI